MSKELEKALKTAYKLLSYRPRSQAEMVSRLKRRGFSQQLIELTISKLKEQGLVDDKAFASFWQENRQRFKPCSRRLISWELSEKGITPSIIKESIAELDDGESAYLAGKKKAEKLSKTDFSTFKRKLSSFLYRRGFSAPVIKDAVMRLWGEVKSS